MNCENVVAENVEKVVDVTKVAERTSPKTWEIIAGVAVVATLTYAMAKCGKVVANKIKSKKAVKNEVTVEEVIPTMEETAE